MATSPFFRYNVSSEQDLYEDLVIESLKFYGHDVYYIPREVVESDEIFSDEILSRFSNAYKIEMFIENIDGFDGDGDLFTKFGVEIRDACTFVVSRKRFRQEIGLQASGGNPNAYYRPREGDIIHLPLSQSTFQIMNVVTEDPFFQLSNLPVFKMRCELFEYHGEDFNTKVDTIDRIEKFSAYQYVLTMDSASNGFEVGETISQINGDYTLSGKVVNWSDSDNKLYLTQVSSTDAKYHTFTTTNQITGLESSSVATPSIVEELQKIYDNQTDFDISALEFLDFSEDNPFGDPS